VFLDDDTGEPEFVTVNTGLVGTNENFVPVKEVTFNDGTLTLPYSKDKVKDSPNVDISGGHLSQDEERRVYEYFGLAYSERRSDSGLPDGGTTGMTMGTTDFTDEDVDMGVGQDTSGPETDDAMTRSEEHVNVGTRSEETGRARLRKYVVTEEETHTIPVRKEKAVIEREPITDANRDEALDGPDISEEDHEVTLREERPVIDKTTEPVERVRLGKEEITDEENVTEEVRKERIEAEGDVDDRNL
jgi:uncharacterized protein (TIGR02271 family)